MRQMTDEERLVADFHGSGMSTGPHPMTYCREALSKLQVKRACDLPRVPDGQYTRVAGCVIARQRPGTAKRSEEHTSELQSHLNLVCRLLLEKKKKQKKQVVESCPLKRRRQLPTLVIQ